MQHDRTRLELNDVSKSIDEKVIVSKVSLSLNAGQVTCLLGPSGCGKSTTLRIIAGLEQLDSGEILIDGVKASGPTTHIAPEKRTIGMMFQDFALFPHLSVGENVAYAMKGSRAEQRERVRQLLNRVNLQHFIDEYPHVLSGGEQQRIALIRALAARPKIMLMDEPFSGLDNRLRDGIRDETLAILKDEGTAVLLVTHEPEEAMRMADEIALMRNGEIVQKGAPYNVYNAPIDRETMAFFSDINVINTNVKGSLAKTKFGDFFAPGFPDGAPLEIVFRPQHVHIDFDRSGDGPAATVSRGAPSAARVKKSRFLGHESLIEFIMEDDGSRLVATMPHIFLPEKGRRFWLTLPRDKCQMFSPKD